MLVGFVGGSGWWYSSFLGRVLNVFYMLSKSVDRVPNGAVQVLPHSSKHNSFFIVRFGDRLMFSSTPPVAATAVSPPFMDLVLRLCRCSKQCFALGLGVGRISGESTRGYPSIINEHTTGSSASKKLVFTIGCCLLLLMLSRLV